jgi:hypothetical protein
MKLLMTILFLISTNLVAAELGEDASNVDCVKSIHGSRPFLATVKKPVAAEEEKETFKPKEVKTIEK